MFKRKLKPDADGFFETAVPPDAISQNAMTPITINGEPIILTRWEGTIYAYSAYCPHAAADLQKGEVYRGRVDCPEHGWRFDLKTGRTLYPPDEACRLKRFAVREAAGRVWVKIS